MNKESEKLFVNVVNLEDRKDRLFNIQKEFENRNEFNVSIKSTIKNPNGAVGLWENIVQIVKKAKNEKHEYIIICEDDHQFTASYNKNNLYNSIEEAQQMGADVLMGGVSWFTDVLQVSSGLFWVDKFSGLQFTVIYQKFFKAILEADFGAGDAADYKIADLTQNKFLMYPFISTQKEFGYSDVTLKNNTEGRVTEIFKNTSEKLSHLEQVASFYNLKHKA